MKSLLFILFLIPAAGSFAQSDSTRPTVLYRLPDGTIAKDSITPLLRMRADQFSMKPWLDSSRISHRTQRGQVYKMPVDNMPCLVPDKNKVEAYWGAKPIPDNRMPNAFDKRKKIRYKNAEQPGQP